MRTLFEIIEAVKDGDMPEYDEIYWALLAYEFLSSMDQQLLLKFATEEMGKPFSIEFYVEEERKMWRNALNVPPKDYVGESGDPANPEYQKIRSVAKRLFDKFIAEDSDEKD